MSDQSPIPRVAPFTVSGSLTIAPESYVRDMDTASFVGLKPKAGDAPWEAYPHLRFGGTPRKHWKAVHLEALAEFFARCEAEGAVPGFEILRENAELQPIEYLYLNENSRYTLRALDENRHSHEWSLYEHQGKFILWFEHGHLGARRQTFDKLSDGLQMAQALVGGHPWEDFGDEDSRRTLLRKGQFYWEAENDEPIPVDNFLFHTDCGQSFRISASGNQSILGWTYGELRAYVWNEDHAESLDKLADILQGLTSPEGFHADDMTDEDGFGWQPSAVPALALPATGALEVRDIYRSNDRHPATKLSFRTKQGHLVMLDTSMPTVELTNTGMDGTVEARTYGRQDIATVFRALARVLRGDGLGS